MPLNTPVAFPDGLSITRTLPRARVMGKLFASLSEKEDNSPLLLAHAHEYLYMLRSVSSILEAVSTQQSWSAHLFTAMLLGGLRDLN